MVDPKKTSGSSGALRQETCWQCKASFNKNQFPNSNNNLGFW